MTAGRRTPWPAALVAAACVVAAPVPASSATRGSPAAPDLAGSTFKVKSWWVGGVPRPVAEKARSGITFADNGRKLSAYFGCNQISGTYAIFRGRLRTPDLVMTKAYCAETAAQEQALVTLLRSVLRVSLVGSRLVLKTPGSRLVLTERQG